jgi:hypothetical protein
MGDMSCRTAWTVVAVAALLLLLGVCTSSEAKTVAAPRFSNTVLLEPQGHAEPAIAIGNDGTMAITALTACSPLECFYTNLWKGPFGSTPISQGPIDFHIEGSYGGDDADVDLGATGALHVSTLMFRFNGEQLGISSIACPGAETSNDYAHCTSQLIDTNGTDRPWITSDGRHVYITYHDSGHSATIRVQRSDDDGITWKRVGDATSGLGGVTATATFNNEAGPIVVDPHTHTVYTLFDSGTPQTKSSRQIVHNKLYVASSSDFGAHWTAHLVYEAPPPTNFGEPFPGGLAVDPVTGRLFTAFSDGKSIFFARSADGGTSWSAPRVLNVAPAQTAVFPAVAASGATVDVTYYGTSASNHGDFNAVWNVYLTKSIDGGEHFGQSTVTTTPNHEGEVCTDGSACTTDRSLADLFEIAIEPKSRRAAIIYSTDTVGPPFQITSGPHEGTYRSNEGLFTKSLLTLPEKLMRGSTTYVGTACGGEPVPRARNAQTIAVIKTQSGCLFQEQAEAALNAGYAGFVLFNDLGERAFHMGAFSQVEIPGETVGHSTGLAIFNAASDSELVVGESGASISVGRLRVQVALAQETP